MSGPRRDLTQGPIARGLLLFALPTLGSSVLQSLNGSINAVWVGRFLGEDALAATSNANLVMFLMVSAVFGFGMAATVLIGQAMGRRDVDGARRVVGTLMGMSLVLSIAVVAVGWFSAPALLRLLATDRDVFPLALAYLRVIFLAMPGSFIAMLLMMSLRGAGDSLTPLWTMALSAVIDVTLNPVLILGLGPAPRMGIAGAATATLIASYVSMVALVIAIEARGLVIRLKGAEWRYLNPDPAIVRLLVTKGFPMGLQMIVVSIAALAVIGLVNRAGVITTAAYGVTTQIWTYIQMPAMALSAAVSAFAAQNIGAGAWPRVDRVARLGVILNVAMTGMLVLLVMAIDRPLLGLFLASDSPAIPIAGHINSAVSWTFLLFGATMVLGGVMRANGIVWAPLLILAIAVLPVRLGIAFALESRHGVDGVWWSFAASAIVSLVLTALYYQLSDWRQVRLAVPPAAEEIAEQAHASCEPAGKLQPTV